MFGRGRADSHAKLQSHLEAFRELDPPVRVQRIEHHSITSTTFLQIALFAGAPKSL